MVKRKSLPWAPNCVPDMRRQWCNALDTLVERQSAALAEPSDASGEGARRLQRLQAKLAESLSQMSAEADAIKSASLFWVSRDMVDVALDAADSLPEWTPAIAAPAPTGVLCWAKPAGSVPWNGVELNGPHRGSLGRAVVVVSPRRCTSTTATLTAGQESRADRPLRGVLATVGHQPDPDGAAVDPAYRGGRGRR